ncbi:hypothetical protein C8R42DRAFT_169472 [Lentinula raphanica]|nr:hypothetical protein C8R42DRAFT_169472 [Lentinula raphanica]
MIMQEISIESRFRSLLQSNEPPSPLDALAASEVLKVRLAQMSELERQLAKLQAEAQMCNTILSGIRKLPPELLADIFLQLVAPDQERYYRLSIYSSYPKADPSQQASAIVLSHVCRKWRSVALSTPQLWSTISVPHRTPLASSVYDGLVKMCINHSRVSPLYITLSVLSSSNAAFRSASAKGPRYSAALETLNKFMPEITRWRYFHFDLLLRQLNSPPDQILPTLPPDGAPDLRKVYFRMHFEQLECPETRWMLELLRASPNLRHITFSAPLSNLVAAPWVHLQHFYARGGIRLRDLFLVFGGCPVLEICEASFELAEEGPSLPTFRDSDSAIVLAHLRVLEFTHLRHAELTTVLQWLTLPSLRVLVLAGHVSDSWPDELFRSFLTRSACKLHTLSLSRLAHTDAELMDYLRFPNIQDTLEVLVLDKWTTPISSDLLDFLTFKFTESPADSPVLPKLNDVTFAINALFQAVHLRKFFLSRWYERDRNQAPFPVAVLKRLAVNLLTPFLPNASVSGERIRNLFTRVEDMVEIELETYVIQGGTDYPDIEKLSLFDVI